MVPPPGLVPIASVSAPAVASVGWVVNCSALAAPGLTVNVALPTDTFGGPAVEAVSVNPAALRLRISDEKVATPAAALTDVVPESTAPPGLVPSAIVTLPVKLVA